jgi:multisubunit Na+/H+ antiporter MnhC subunit
VNGTFSVTGGTGTGVDFIVTDPNGKQLSSSNFTSARSFSFSAKINGTYVMSFDNSFCSCEGGKNVTLEYSVSNSGGTSIEAASSEGFPVISALVLTAAIAAVSVVAVVFLIGRPKANLESAKVTSAQNVG